MYIHAFHKNISVVRKLYFNHTDRHKKKNYKELKPIECKIATSTSKGTFTLLLVLFYLLKIDKLTNVYTPSHTSVSNVSSFPQRLRKMGKVMKQSPVWTACQNKTPQQHSET